MPIAMDPNPPIYLWGVNLREPTEWGSGFRYRAICFGEHN
ncbi:MAG: hypothetical protein KatS3mg130_0442 [Candidatus Sumerlaea sp.]|jgi:hypothetical protein|uniref:Uncharacterized protein n=1 Tax=Sumerlaea chitinivorans TaxID=2250252 RepID=A0A2Z4Y5M9_SUMC1|nr:hypothetical protein BRCON_1235 [Candidatus Sumerlaea chitinivorans]GIX44034.1 MAG: hypothetical protein KatS3mg130_0442 [Candidatus Sumerlaea sp.]